MNTYKGNHRANAQRPCAALAGRRAGRGGGGAGWPCWPPRCEVFGVGGGWLLDRGLVDGGLWCGGRGNVPLFYDNWELEFFLNFSLEVSHI